MSLRKRLMRGSDGGEDYMVIASKGLLDIGIRPIVSFCCEDGMDFIFRVRVANKEDLGEEEPMDMTTFKDHADGVKFMKVSPTRVSIHSKIYFDTHLPGITHAMTMDIVLSLMNTIYLPNIIAMFPTFEFVEKDAILAFIADKCKERLLQKQGTFAETEVEAETAESTEVGLGSQSEAEAV